MFLSYLHIWTQLPNKANCVKLYVGISNDLCGVQDISINTLRAGLIQAVRKKQLIRTWLCG